MNAKRALLLLLLAAVALVGPQMTMMAGCQAAQVARQVVVTTTLPVPSSALPSPSRSPLPGMLGGLCSHNQSCQGPNLFCAFPNLLCGGPGVCSARPDLCTADFRPVCGCDFQTYSNPCAAATAGQAIFSNRACNTTRRCTRDNDCGSGFHCRFPAERCSGLGLCSEKPDACTLELNPVCGCNNQTYSNPCLAFSSGVSIQSLGECPVENAFACRSDEDCAQKQYCRFDAGSCGGEGTCINVPDTCTLELNPVCGCNNQTYDNPCIASSAGVSLTSLGACEDVQPCMNDTECDFGQFCRFESGTCGGMGSCANAPTVCTLELNPVCGCDNVTYDSPCVAQASGVSILDLAPCQETTACSNDSDCAINEYCHFSMGQCGGNGSCASFPEACSLLLNPVCGCDGETYDSPCVAALAGTSVEFMGSCNATEGSSLCTTDSDCPAEDQFCQFTDGQCSGEGSCVDIPQFCTLELRPVCGCNGQTYNNRCRALAQGVSIRSANGACAAPVRPM